MTGILKVDTIQSSGGTNAVTIASDGKVTGSVNDSRQCVMGFMLTSGVSGGADPITGWTNTATQVSARGAGQITRGGSVSHSSGTFTFPFTGLWQIEFYAIQNADGQDNTLQYDLRTTLDGGTTYTTLTQVKGGVQQSGYKQNAQMKALFKVGDTTQHKMKFRQTSFSGSDKSEADANAMLTYCIFTWLGDAD